MSERSEKATRVIETLWDDATEYAGDTTTGENIARALDESGLLATQDVHWLAEIIRNTSKTTGWKTKHDLMRSTLHLVDLILGPDPDPPVPLMVPTPDTGDWDF